MNNSFSIIIPVYNNVERLLLVLNALKIQDYDKALYEVIVVDNGSDDGLSDYLAALDGITLLKETKYQGSPYSARNRGIEASKNQILAFLDSTCIPTKMWLKNADMTFATTEADLVAGNIVFEINSNSTLGELYDSLYSVNVKSATTKNRAPGGNLFIKKSLLLRFGMFKEGVRSGEDYGLTKRLIDHGAKLIYSEDAVVTYPPRSLKLILAKQARVAKGQARIWREERQTIVYLLKAAFHAFIPPNPIELAFLIRNRGYSWMIPKLVGIYALAWYVRAKTFMYNCIAVVNYKHEN